MIPSITKFLFWKTESSQPQKVAEFRAIYERIMIGLHPNDQRDLDELIYFLRSEAEHEYVFHNSGADQ